MMRVSSASRPSVQDKPLGNPVFTQGIPSHTFVHTDPEPMLDTSFGFGETTKTKVTPPPSLIHNQFFVFVQLSVSNTSVSLFALLDSGSVGNFISSTLVQSLCIPVELACSVSVKALDGRLVSNNSVTQITTPESLTIEPAHSELLQFYVLHHNQPSLVLGLPWLRLHNPDIDWQLSKIRAWSPICESTCFPNSAGLHHICRKPTRSFPCEHST